MANTRTEAEAVSETPMITDQSPKPQILIGINGYKYSGKDTAARFIEEWGNRRGLTTAKRAYADMAVLSMMRSFGLATNLNDARILYDSFKVNGGVSIEIPDQSIGIEISGRQFIKWYATEGHRDVFGQDFWVDKVLPLGFDDVGRTWQDNFWPDDPTAEKSHICLVTDVRFVNEAQRVKDLGGKIWRIERGLRPDGHSSEQPLPDEMIDIEILNYSSLEAFESEVCTQMTAEYHMKFVEWPRPDHE